VKSEGVKEVNVKASLIAALVAISLGGPAYAQDPDRPAMPSIDSILSGLVQEEDVAVAFRYLRESLDDALMGREPAPPPDALMQRAETIGKEFKRRGGAAAHSVLDVIEGILREEVRSPPRGTPSKPVQRLGTRI
jgi:hypothetical protein